MDAAGVKAQQELLLRRMPQIMRYEAELSRLNKQWTRTTLTGKINCNRIASTLIEFMISTQESFRNLQDDLISTLVFESVKKTVLEQTEAAQSAIDILKRNLFERTADVGFLATDTDICTFLATEECNDPEAVDRIVERLREYRAKYTVYYEIIILDMEGKVRAHLDESNRISATRDPLLSETLQAEEYVETFRASDLVPGRGDVLLYSQTIKDGETGRPLGVLCLCFDFGGEMESIFGKLTGSSQGIIVAILDKQHRVIASSDKVLLPAGSVADTALDKDYALCRHDGAEYVVVTRRTNGYQGFYGLEWYGHAMRRADYAFAESREDSTVNEEVVRSSTLYSGAMAHVDTEAENVLADLQLVVQNGEVMAAKKSIDNEESIQRESRALPPVLSEIQKVGAQIRTVFSQSIRNLLQTVIAARLYDLEFLASLAIDIMDRNLYERANDCRWWALTSYFRRMLSQREIIPDQAAQAADILAYINSLYTVYTNLFVYDRDGRVAAVSNPAEKELVGQRLGAEWVRHTLGLKDSQLYTVSAFESTPLYAGPSGPRHTYVYNAAIASPNDHDRAVGGIGIVFDSEPEFKAMLHDALPRDDLGQVMAGSAGFFIDRQRRIISSTDPERTPGQTLNISERFVKLGLGESLSDIITLNGRQAAVGCRMSSGYREYKTDGAYENDVAALIITEM